MTTVAVLINLSRWKFDRQPQNVGRAGRAPRHARGRRRWSRGFGAGRAGISGCARARCSPRSIARCNRSKRATPLRRSTLQRRMRNWRRPISIARCSWWSAASCRAPMSTASPPRATQRARVAVAEAQYSELLARNARLNIVAPAAGLLLERNVEPGQTVSAGSLPLFLIAKGGEMELLVRRRISCSAGSIPPRSCGRVGGSR